jgi:hypothetical protein
MMSDDVRRDLDETRRLLYMVKAASLTNRYNLVGTLTNALSHHEGNVGTNPDEAMANLVDAVNGDPDALDWVKARLGDISDTFVELNDRPEPFTP